MLQIDFLFSSVYMFIVFAAVSDIVKLLTHAIPHFGNARDSQAQTPLICAVICENRAVSSALLSSKVNVQVSINTANPHADA